MINTPITRSHINPDHFKKGRGIKLRRPNVKRKFFFRMLTGLLLAVALIYVSSFVYNKMCHAKFFQITNIRIEGCNKSSKTSILAFSGIDIHSNLLALDIGRLSSAVEKHRWVQSAAIKRIWPNQLLITVQEKVPVALINLADGLSYLDKNGNAFAPAVLPGDLDFPVITGADDKSALDLSANKINLPLKQALQFIQYAGNGNFILPKQNISEINLTEDGRMVLFLLDGPFPIYLDSADINTQYSRLVKILKELYKKKELAAIAYIKMDYMKNKALVVRKKTSV